MKIAPAALVALGISMSTRSVALSALHFELGNTNQWGGEGVNERGINPANGKPIVAVDPRYFRPTEVETLLGDPSKAKEKLGWEPEIPFLEIVKEMVQADLEEANRDELVQRAGFIVYNHQE